MKKAILTLSFLIFLLSTGFAKDFTIEFGTVDNRAISHQLSFQHLQVGNHEVSLTAPEVSIDNWYITGPGNLFEPHNPDICTWLNGVLRCVSSQNEHHAHLKDVELESFEYIVRLKSTQTAGIGIVVLSQWLDGKDQYYRLRPATAERTYRVSPRPQEATDRGDFELGDSSDSRITLAANKWHWTRTRVLVRENDVQILGKFWLDGTNEPEGWQINYIDPAKHYARGAVGVWFWGGTAEFDNFSIKKLEYVSDEEIHGINSFGFAIPEIVPGTYMVKAKTKALFDFESEWSEPVEFIYEEEIEEILLEITRPTILKIIIK